MNYSAPALPLYLYLKRNQEISPLKGFRSVGMSGVSGNGEVGKNEDKKRESGKPDRDAKQLEPARKCLAHSRLRFGFFPLNPTPPDS